MAASDGKKATMAITGAARGIGAATARLLAARGMRVAIADIDGDMVKSTAAEIGGDVTAFQLDVSDRDAFKAFVDAIEADLGPLTVMINNAGIATTAPSTITQDPAIIDRTIAVNLNGVINGTLAALEVMIGRSEGQVVNVASLAGVMGVPGLTVYSASKFGVVGFTEAIRAEYDGAGIDFTCVMPGPVSTDMMAGTHKARAVRLIAPEEIAEAIAGSLVSKRTRISVPRSSGVVARISSLMSPKVAIRFNRLIGMDRVYTEIDETARAEYAARIKSAAE